MAMIKCSECGKQMSDNAKVCPHCGYKNEVVICPECGEKITDKNIKNCPNCGVQIQKQSNKIFENIKTNYLIKIAFIIFIIQRVFDFYSSIKLDNINVLLTGIIDNFYWFLVLYVLCLSIVKEKQ